MSIWHMSIEANIVDPDQAVWSGSTLFVYEASNILVDDKKHLGVYKCEFSVYTVRIFMKCTHVCAAQKAYCNSLQNFK